MSENPITFQSGNLNIEGLFEKISNDKGVVVTHPHSLYGGDMYNNVVETITEAYRERGYSTLRFNFMGVGQSEGSFDQGIGEQENVKAALSYLRDSGLEHIDLAGYSFGAWVNAAGIENFDLARRLVMVSPPVSFMDFSSIKQSDKIRLIITGTDDDIADWKKIEDYLNKWNQEAVFRTIQGADHFYWGQTGELKKILNEFLAGT
jgi:alpha/beta superfamily hydrolase